MDIVDVMLARALTPQGSIERYAELAQQAVAQAEEATETATAAAETASQIVGDITSAIDAETKKLLVDLTNHTITNGIGYDLITTYPDNTKRTLQNVLKLYTTTGQHTDGAMTQKSITEQLNALWGAIGGGGGGGGGGDIPSFDPSEAGRIIIVGSDGTITTSLATEEEILNALIRSGDYVIKDAAGLMVDYANRSAERASGGASLTPGSDFDKFSMFGGRMRCNVADDGRIIAWYGDSNYAEDGSNGQVMVYQPKFYYSRIPIEVEDKNGGKVIRKESIIISETKQPGVKIHPLFVTPEGEELDYVLISAYEGSIYHSNSNTYETLDGSNVDFSVDKLCSIANVKPMSGRGKSITTISSEQLAENRGTGWHITNLALESAIQMLGLTEYGSLNGQESFDWGVVSISNVSPYNCSSFTGSTSALGNTTGYAAETINEHNGIYNTYSDQGRRAISYRGMENPWGNIWRFVGGLNLVGDGSSGGGKPYICKDFNYSTSTGNNYEYVGFYVSSRSDWISGFGYSGETYDWVFLPVECLNANSAVPVGDNLWVTGGLRGTNAAMIGGLWSFGRNSGPFYYAFDKSINESTQAYGARLMFIPTKNDIYESNYANWQLKMEG